MKLHANAALSLNGRRRMALLEVGRPLSRRGRARPVGSFLGAAAGPQPHRRAHGPVACCVATVAVHRPPELSELLRLPISTISGILKRIGMGRLGRLGLEPAVRYERERPGELIHIDVKELGRIKGGAGKRFTGIARNQRPSRTDAASVRRHTAGWDAVHVAVDDATRLAYVEVLPDEKALTAVGFLHTVERVISDNRSTGLSTAHTIACRTLGIRHLRTRPYRPQTNGKAERFIRTMLSGWAYGAIYASSTERTAALDGWLFHYNHHRPHQALGRQTPATKLNNLLGTYS